MKHEPKVTIIAELGINHNGDFDKALKMILAAKAAGVSIVKFQHYDALKLLGPSSPYLEYASRCQFSKTQHEQLKQFCDDVGMEYLVSVFDIADVPWADNLCKRHKVASRMNQNEEFKQALLDTGKEVIMSVQKPRGSLRFRLMYCITEYPTLEEKLQFLPCSYTLGLSSHCPSIRPTLKAIAQGATIVEHHVTFSREDEGCDQSSSITFDQLKQLNTWANELEIV
jgi:sialic acid synthase SpsE